MASTRLKEFWGETPLKGDLLNLPLGDAVLSTQYNGLFPRVQKGATLLVLITEGAN